MSVLAAIGGAAIKGVGALARGIKNRKIAKLARKSGGTAPAAKTGLLTRIFNPSPEVKARRIERRTLRRTNREAKQASGGGFLKKAIAARRARKAAGQLPRQLRQARKAALSAGQTPTDVTTGLPDPMALITGDPGKVSGWPPPTEVNEPGETPGEKASQGIGAAWEWITNNWIVIAIGIGIIFLYKALFTKKSKRK